MRAGALGGKMEREEQGASVVVVLVEVLARRVALQQVPRQRARGAREVSGHMRHACAGRDRAG